MISMLIFVKCLIPSTSVSTRAATIDPFATMAITVRTSDGSETFELMSARSFALGQVCLDIHNSNECYYLDDFLPALGPPVMKLQ